MTNSNQSIANALKLLRTERNITQYQLANILGISTSTICLWEQGERFPNKRLRETLCSYFNVDMNFLCGYSTVRKSSIENDEVLSVDYYDRRCLKEGFDRFDLRFNKDIFDTDSAYTTMLLPKTLFRNNAHYFAINSKEEGLSPFGVNAEDILVFAQANSEDVEDKTIVCALLNGKIVVRLFRLSNESNCFYLAKSWDDEALLKIPNANEKEIIIGKLTYVFGRR